MASSQFYFLKFYNSCRFSKKLQRQYREFMYIPYPVPPIFHISHYYGPFVTMKKHLDNMTPNLL